MATTTKNMTKRKQPRQSAEYRTEALALAERIGVAAAARELGVHAGQIYQWRAKAAHQHSISDRERQLAEKAEEVEILGVSRSGYYAWLRRVEQGSQREEVRIKRDAKVIEVFLPA